MPPEEVDVRRIRAKAGMSQAEFARVFCINPRTLQEWEQGRRKLSDPGVGMSADAARKVRAPQRYHPDVMTLSTFR